MSTLITGPARKPKASASCFQAPHVIEKVFYKAF